MIYLQAFLHRRPHFQDTEHDAYPPPHARKVRQILGSGTGEDYFNAMDEELLKRAVSIVEENIDNFEFSTDELRKR